MRASLDHDAQALTAGQWSDTKLPQNYNDEDIWPEMENAPPPRNQFTQLTFSLVRWELAAMFLRFGKLVEPNGHAQESDYLVYEEMLDEVRKGLQDRYLKY